MFSLSDLDSALEAQARQVRVAETTVPEFKLSELRLSQAPVFAAQTWQSHAAVSVPAVYSLRSGINAADKPGKTTDEAVAQLLRGYSPIPPEAPRTITYSFRATAPAANDGNAFGDITAFQRVTSAQITAIQSAMQRWAEVANVTFQEVFGDGGSVYSDAGSILLGNYTTAYTGSGGFTGSGGIWFNNSGNAFPDVLNPVIGSTVYEVLYVHELGHVLGLAHPSNYDSGSGKPITYAKDASYREDSRQYTVMSYFDASNTGGSWTVGSTTPMLHDIAAVQRLYGANNVTRLGDTQYGFFSNAGEAFNIANNTIQRTFTIWDGGGTDYLNMALYTQDQVLNLQAESYSSTGGQKNNIVIARNVTIENAEGGKGNDSISGNDVDNILDGGFGTGNDTIAGLNGNDTLYGWDGNDLLNGGFSYTDKLYGGTGNDTYIIDDLNDVVTEYAGEGRDLIVSTIRYVLPVNVEDLTLTGISSVNAFGNDLDNYIKGNSGNNYLQGYAGLDTLAGGAGNDYYEIADRGFIDEFSGYAPDRVIEAVNGGIDTVSVSNQDGNLYFMDPNVENAVVAGSSGVSIFGNDLGNNMLGNLVYNLFYGEGGNDTLDGASGIDDLRGGTGDDLYILNDVNSPNRFSTYTYDSVLEFANEGTDTVRVLAIDLPTTISTDRYTLGANIENGIIIGNIAFDMTGNELHNALTGNDLPNTLTGLTGNDILNGGVGVDTLVGGLGNDTYVLTDIAVANRFELYHYDYATEAAGEGIDTVIVTAIDNPDTLFSVDGYTLGANIENGIIAGTLDFYLTGNGLNNALTGNAAANTLNGVDGNDTLAGGAGRDTLAGGVGDDVYVMDSSDIVSGSVVQDIIQETAGAGIDTVMSSVRWVLGANVENLILTGNVTANGFGNALDNNLTGNSAYNYLDGGAGYDTLAGGAFDDYYNLDDTTVVGGVARFDRITEAVNAGTDTVAVWSDVGQTGYNMASNVEIGLIKGNLAFTLSGNDVANTLTGNDAVNRLNGLDGNDSLNGGLGVDNLFGGLGNDTYLLYDLSRANNFSLYRYDSVGELAGEGTDTVIIQTIDNPDTVATERYTLGDNVENGTLLGAIDFILTGNELANTLIGNSAANSLTGNAGDDLLNGGAGVDRLVGNAGNDTYVLGDLARANAFEIYHYDYVTEGANQGIDTVVVTALDNPDTVSVDHYTLGANIENATITGSIVFNLIGNDLNNILTGNAAANILSAGDGNDSLIGGAGRDTLNGGAGDDTYIMDNSDIVAGVGIQDVVQEASTWGTDTVMSSFTWTLDTFVENLILTGSAVADATGNTLANTITGNAAANFLNGGAGYDSLAGGAGDDTYYLVDATTVSGVLRYDRVTEVVNAGIDTVALQSGIGITGYSLVANIESAVVLGGQDFNLGGNELDNRLLGNAGANRIYGDIGADTLYGGMGNDMLNGGAGADIFVLNTVPNAATNVDAIADFSVADDTIWLDHTVYAALLGGVLQAADFVIGSAAATASQNIIYDSAAGKLYYDPDGSNASVQTLIATLSTGLAMTNTDFYVI